MFNELMEELAGHRNRLIALHASVGDMLNDTAALHARLMYLRENAERKLLGVRGLDAAFLAETVGADG